MTTTTRDPTGSDLSVAASLQLPQGFAGAVARAMVRAIARDPEERRRFLQAIKDDPKAQAVLGLDDPWPAEAMTISAFVRFLREWQERAKAEGGSRPPLMNVTEAMVWNRIKARWENGLQNGVHYSQGEEGTAIYLHPPAFIAWWLRGSRRA